MGRSGKGKQVAERPADDDALLDAAIAENKATQAKAHTQQQQKAPAEKEARKQPAAAPAGVALTKDQIIEKLNAVPSFCLLNGETNIVGLQDPENPKFEVCFWMTDAADAKEMLAAAKQNNSAEVASRLHLGVTPLGIAFALASGWMETSFYGDMRLRGAQEDTENVTAMLQGQVAAQGMEQASWQVPVFCCDELQSPQSKPMFLSRKALQESWVVSGRKLADLPQTAVMDLRVLVAQMQTDAFSWRKLEFVTARRCIQLVKEAKAAAPQARGQVGPEAAAAAAAATAGAGDGGNSGDTPPPLEGDRPAALESSVD